MRSAPKMFLQIRSRDMGDMGRIEGRVACGLMALEGEVEGV